MDLLVLFVLQVYYAVLSVPCSLVVTCLERAYLLVILYVMFSCVFVTFSYDVLGQEWYLIALIPDLCILPYSWVKVQNFKNLELSKFISKKPSVCLQYINIFKIKWLVFCRWIEAIEISLIQHFEADFLWKVSLKILNSGTILKTFTHAYFKNIGKLQYIIEPCGRIAIYGQNWDF